MLAAAKFRTRAFDQGCTHKLKTTAIDEVSGLWLSHRLEGWKEDDPVFEKNRRTPQNAFKEIMTTKDGQENMTI